MTDLPAFATERDLCDAFRVSAEARRWTVYAETSGWDLLLLAPSGIQLGVQAKLRFNAQVLRQTVLEAWARDVGPDYRAVLVPKSSDLIFVAEWLGIVVFTPCRSALHVGGHAYGGFAAGGSDRWDADDGTAWFDWNPADRHPLPEYVPDVPAGVPGPRQLTPWKIAALRVLALLERDGFVTREEISALGCDPRRWCSSDGWLVPAGQRGRWTLGPSCPRFDEQHPTVYADIVAKMPGRIPDQMATAWSSSIDAEPVLGSRAV